MRVAAGPAVWFACAAACLGAVDTTGDSPKELAMVLARKAARAEKAGQSAEAYIYYSEAAAIQPSNRRYRSKMAVLQTRAAGQSKPQPRPSPAAEKPEPSALVPPDLKPEDVFDNMTARELAQARELKTIPSLHAAAGTKDFDLNANPRVLFTRVAEAFGLQTIFDGDYPPSDPAVRFRIAGIGYREALHDLEAATGSFVIPLSPRVFMVAKDTPQKRTDLEQTMAVAVPIPELLTVQEITEIGQVLKQAVNIDKIAWDTAQSRLVIRDRVSRVLPALGILDQLLSYRPEVMIELQFLQVDSSDIENYGFTVANSFSAYYFGQIFQNAVSIPSGVTALLSFGGGRTLVGLTAAQVSAMFNSTLSDSNSLYHAQMRSVAGQPATLHVGEKYPIVTGGYVGGAVASSTGQTYAPPPQFTFENLGLELKITPFVHGMGYVTLTIETSFEVLAGSAVNNIPIIGRRDMKSQIRIRDDEWAVVGGLTASTKSKGVNGFAGLAEIPLLGFLFRQTSTDKEQSDVLIGIRPHLISLPPDQILTRSLRVGSETRPFSIL